MTRFYWGEQPTGTYVVWCCTDDMKFSMYGYTRPEEQLSALILLLLEIKKMGLQVIDPPLEWTRGAIGRSTPVDPTVLEKAIRATI